MEKHWPLKRKYRAHYEPDKKRNVPGFGGRAGAHVSDNRGTASLKGEGKKMGRALSGRGGSFRGRR